CIDFLCTTWVTPPPSRVPRGSLGGRRKPGLARNTCAGRRGHPCRAVDQLGNPPRRAGAPESPPDPNERAAETVGGAAPGAALCAAADAISGNAGRGAGAGAVVGGVHGRRRTIAAQHQRQYVAQNSYTARLPLAWRGDYTRCDDPRGFGCPTYLPRDRLCLGGWPLCSHARARACPRARSVTSTPACWAFATM